MKEAKDLFLNPREYFSLQVKDGLIHRKIDTHPVVEGYLTDLLSHYVDIRNLFQQDDETGKLRQDTLAELLLKASSSEVGVRIELLKRLGDSALYISGFFGDSLERKIVDIDYYIEMGGTAYSSLSNCVREDTMSWVYREFSTRFVDYVDVLNYISQKSFVQSDQSILRLYDRYLRTGSDLARDALHDLGVMTMPLDQARKIKPN